MALTSRDGLEEERRLLYVALTRPRRALHLYVPARYFHQPHGASDASGLGNTSRFLTDEVRSLCEVVHASEPTATLAGEQIHEQIRVGVDALWI